MNDTEPGTTARHPRVMDPIIAGNERATIVKVNGDKVYVTEGDWQATVFIDRLRWTGTAWVIIPEHAA